MTAITVNRRWVGSYRFGRYVWLTPTLWQGCEATTEGNGFSTSRVAFGGGGQARPLHDRSLVEGRVIEGAIGSFMLPQNALGNTDRDVYDRRRGVAAANGRRGHARRGETSDGAARGCMSQLTDCPVPGRGTASRRRGCPSVHQLRCVVDLGQR